MSASASTSNLSVNEEKENVPPNDFQVLLNELGEIYVHITVNDDLIEKLKLKKDCALSYYDKYINIIPILEQSKYILMSTLRFFFSILFNFQLMQNI